MIFSASIILSPYILFVFLLIFEDLNVCALDDVIEGFALEINILFLI